MSSLLREHMKSAAAGVHQQIGVNRFGIVTSTRKTDTGYDVKVLYDYGEDNQAQSGWMPVLSPFVGPTWGLVCPPIEGMLAFVAPDMGDGNHGVVLGLSWNQTDRPPQAPNAIDGDQKPVEAGEFSIVSKAGAVFRFCSDGTVYFKTSTVNIEGDLVVKGNITSQKGNIAALKGDVSDTHGSLDRLRGNYDSHRHTQVQSGNGSSGLTDHNDPE